MNASKALTGKVMLPSDSALSVVRDIYYMKLISVEVVSQLALDTVYRAPMDTELFYRLTEQVQEEVQHLNKCRILLATRNALGKRPDYIFDFAHLMRVCGGKQRRTLPLATAVILCIAVEISAMRQLAAASSPDFELHNLLHELGADEEDHYRLVANVVAPSAAAHASMLERARAHFIMVRIAAITLGKWWPRQVSSYKALGLDVELFLSEMMDLASRSLRPLGFLFPRRLLLHLARIALHDRRAPIALAPTGSALAEPTKHLSSPALFRGSEYDLRDEVNPYERK